ncbi:hypothetical protein [Phage toucan80]|nr:hypothetical protein [Phage toucan80]
MSFKKKVSAVVVGATAVIATSPLYAQAIDVSDGLDSIDSAGVAIAAVGGALIALAGIALGYRWVKATFF